MTEANTHIYRPADRPIAQRKWNLLWRCKEKETWKTLWNIDSKRTEQQHLYSMCCFMWNRGFNEQEIIFAIATWWKKYGLQGNWYLLRNTILPETFRFTTPAREESKLRYRETRRIQQAQRRARRKAEAAIPPRLTNTDRVLAWAKEEILTSFVISDRLGISQNAAQQLLSRLAKDGRLARIAYGQYAAMQEVIQCKPRA